MTASTSDRIYYDNADVEIGRDPHPMFRRLRNEAPLYYNEEKDFYALSRYDDVATALVNSETYLSGKGATLDLIRSAWRSRREPSSSRTRRPTVSIGRFWHGCSPRRRSPPSRDRSALLRRHPRPLRQHRGLRLRR